MRKENKKMTERMLENRVAKITELEAQIKELQEQANAIKDEIKKDLEAKGVEEVQTKNFLIRWKEIVSNRFDTTAFKKDMPEIYSNFLKESVAKRFTIA